jgi:hypothetical protein
MQNLGFAFTLAGQQRPDLADPVQQKDLVEFCEQNPWVLHGASPSDPQGLADRLVAARDLKFGRTTNGNFAPPTGAATPDDSAKTKAATTKSRGTSNTASDDDFGASILAAAKRVR